MVLKDMIITAASKQLTLKIIGCKKVSSPKVTVGMCFPVILVVRSP